MKVKALGSVLVLLFAVMLASPAHADLVQQPSSQFLDPNIAGVGNLLIPEFVDIPVVTTTSVDCPITGTLDIIADLDVNFTGLGYGIYWDGSGNVPLVFEGGASNINASGTLRLEAHSCLGISLGFDLIGADVSAQLYFGLITTPYLNTATDQIVLATRSDSLFGIENLDLGSGLIDLVEGLVGGWLSGQLTDALFNHGTLAVQGDGGAIHDALEDAMDGIYLPHMCGCVTVTPGGVPTSGHLAVNMGMYLLPLGLILGLKRRMRKR